MQAGVQQVVSGRERQRVGTTDAARHGTGPEPVIGTVPARAGQDMAVQIHLEAQLPVPQVSTMGSRPHGDLAPFARHIAERLEHLHRIGEALRPHRHVQVAGRPEGRVGIVVAGKRVALEQERRDPVPLQGQRDLPELLLQPHETDEALRDRAAPPSPEAREATRGGDAAAAGGG